MLQIIEDLEKNINIMRETQIMKHEKDIKKMKLKYEIMARNEINSRLSEMNAFLNERRKEQGSDEKKKYEVMEAVQNDLANRL